MILNIKNTTGRNGCIRCGTCCKKGGPVLHLEDKAILLKGIITHKDLLTLRKGEFVLNPINGKLSQIKKEVIKVDKRNKDWTCRFYNESGSSCTIYENRPLECKVLKCWDIDDFLKIFCKDTLTRFDLINADDPIIEIINEHEKECPCGEFIKLIFDYFKRKNQKTLSRIKDLINKDLKLRTFALKELELKKEYERFIFGQSFIDIAKIHGININIKDENYNIVYIKNSSFLAG